MTVTIGTVPKAFHDHVGVIQRNAIRCWRAACPNADIVLLGDEVGVADEAASVGARHDGTVRTAGCLPRIDEAFHAIAAAARYEICVYVNADILLMPDFFAAVSVAARLPHFLAVGRRTNLDVTEPIVSCDFGELAARARREGELFSASALDYFVFRRQDLGPIPPFVMGRLSWDPWFLFNAWRRGHTLVDLTPSALVVHQNHGYVLGTLDEVRRASEAKRNAELAGEAALSFSIHDAGRSVVNGGLVRRHDSHHLRRRLRHLALRVPTLGKLETSVRRTVDRLTT
jgi:hypothetical protein